MTPRVQNDVSLYRRHLASSAKKETAMHEYALAARMIFVFWVYVG